MSPAAWAQNAIGAGNNDVQQQTAPQLAATPPCATALDCMNIRGRPRLGARRRRPALEAGCLGLVAAGMCIRMRMHPMPLLHVVAIITAAIDVLWILDS
eukprot:CAMPEP_0170200136 /NCGR_PEP_ID=MMETSP0040_2-20121228/69714_1 /TAXON_ID=641309 /ORGANISM="Lotharella oceanica, Strain CCMP622" /LENGTH=98 /DNA_ID=CAMNT_0010450313 /DNA_START=59 /DNA_END=356 /DNA_ORIENTATION=-